jgi:hypothetical protein
MRERKIYNIYLKDHCIYHNLSQEEFDKVWSSLEHMVDLLDTKTHKEELRYTEVSEGEETSLNPIH